MSMQHDANAEWLEADGRGGFASGTVGGIRTRRYHGLLLHATNPPTGRMMLVNGFDAWVETPGGTFALIAQRYAPNTVAPDTAIAAVSFTSEPWPTWIFELPDGTRIQQEIFARHGAPLVALSWRLLSPADGVTLFVRPFLSGRDYHAMHHENGAFGFQPSVEDQFLVWRTYDGVPDIASLANADYRHEPHWYRNFLYEQELQRGLDSTEDLAAPGVLRWSLSQSEAAWIIGAGQPGRTALENTSDPLRTLQSLRTAERRRRSKFASPLDRAADAYLVARGDGKTIVAGYPWFTDWGRDTFIAMRGLCFATGRFEEARAILLQWSGAVSEGMLPNRFPDHGEAPEYNSVDASLWFVVAVHEYLTSAQSGIARITRDERLRLESAVQSILSGYEAGTRFGIHCDDDGLLAAGVPGVQLTWMDAKVGDWVVTPRIGKPVEVQALWLNALWSARHLSDRWAAMFVRGRDSFRARFWSDVRGYLYDVIDCDHHSGPVDPTFRPNQVFAVGGLPVAIIDNGMARKVVDAVEEKLLTPLGLRSLAPDDPDFAPYYRGGVLERDGAYHRGTVWPWLSGAFVEAWVRVRGDSPDVRRLARDKFLEPLKSHLNDAGLGHVSEVADGVAPFSPGGCPFQAWSVGELLRLERIVLAEAPSRPVSAAQHAAPETFFAAPQPANRHG